MLKVSFKRKTIKEYLDPNSIAYNYIPGLYEIMVELPCSIEELENKYGPEYLFQNIYKYKIGDGKHPYRELKYEFGTIPASSNMIYGYRIKS